MNPTQQQIAKCKARLQQIIDASKARNTDLTDAEQAEVEQIAEEVKTLNERLAKGQATRDLIAEIAAEPTDEDRRNAPGSKWAKSTAQQLTRMANVYGVKALLQGEVAVANPLPIAPLPMQATTLLDLIPRTAISGGNSYEYLRQVTAPNNAAIVPDNATKPVSLYSFEAVEDKVRVIAHLSEPMPIRYAADYPTMLSVLTTEMEQGIKLALEQQIINGDGTGENFKGLLTTTGVLQVPFSGDMITTTRKAITRMQQAAITPTGWVFNVEDFEALELTRENGTTGGFLINADDAQQRLFKVPAVVSTAVPKGTAILADWNTMSVMVREDTTTLAANQAGDLWAKNQMQLRTEGRFGFAIRQPGAVAVVDLTA